MIMKKNEKKKLVLEIFEKSFQKILLNLNIFHKIKIIKILIQLYIDFQNI